MSEANNLMTMIRPVWNRPDHEYIIKEEDKAIFDQRMTSASYTAAAVSSNLSNLSSLVNSPMIGFAVLNLLSPPPSPIEAKPYFIYIHECKSNCEEEQDSEVAFNILAPIIQSFYTDNLQEFDLPKNIEIKHKVSSGFIDSFLNMEFVNLPDLHWPDKNETLLMYKHNIRLSAAYSGKQFPSFIAKSLEPEKNYIIIANAMYSPPKLKPYIVKESFTERMFYYEPKYIQKGLNNPIPVVITKEQDQYFIIAKEK
jgi:hypothetical protein